MTQQPTIILPIAHYQRTLQHFLTGTPGEDENPLARSAHTTLNAVRHAADGLPDLTPGRWFLAFRYRDASQLTLACLASGEKEIQRVSREATECGMPELAAITGEILALFQRAQDSLEILQRPHEPRTSPSFQPVPPERAGPDAREPQPNHNL